MSSLIRYPHDLETDLKQQIRIAFEEAALSFGDEDRDYVLKKGPRVISRLCQSDDWHADLAQAAAVFFNKFSGACESGNNPLSSDLCIVGAALFYLCNPFDIIPDHHAGVGYIDDAYVFDLALKAIAKSNRALFSDITRGMRTHEAVRQ